MSAKSFIRQSLIVLLLCTTFLSAQAFLTRQEINGLTWWNGVKSYPNPPTRANLVDEARRAMESIPEGQRPGMVSALWTGGSDRHIHFASSLSGQTSIPGSAEAILGIDHRVSQALKDCAKDLGNRKKNRHRYYGKCAEIMVIADWYHAQGHAENLPDSGKSIVAVDRSLEFRPPCTGDEGQSGCSQTLTKLGFKPEELVFSDPNPNWKQSRRLCPCPESCVVMRRRGFGGLIERRCVPKKPTAKLPSSPGKPAPPKGQPKSPSNNRPKPTKPKVPSKKGPKH